MKKATTYLVTIGLALMLSISPVLATEGEAALREADSSGVTIEINQDAEATPTPFYFLRRLIQKIRQFLRLEPEEKVAILDELDNLPEANDEAEEGTAVQPQEEQEETEENAEDGAQEPQPEKDEETDIPETVEDPEQKQILDKYQWRIAHLQAIAERNPASAQSGLARAIANAERQRERAIAKGKIIVEANDDSEVDEDEMQIKATGKNKPVVKQGPPPWAQTNKQKHNHKNKKSKVKNR